MHILTFFWDSVSNGVVGGFFSIKKKVLMIILNKFFLLAMWIIIFFSIPSSLIKLNLFFFKTCHLAIASYGWTAADVIYSWKDPPVETTKVQIWEWGNCRCIENNLHVKSFYFGAFIWSELYKCMYVLNITYIWS